MRKILFSLLVFVSLAGYHSGAFAQSLTPQIYGNGTDTVFAFTRLQMKGVTKLIVKGQFDAQTIKKQDQMIANLEKKDQTNRVLISNLYSEIDMHKETIAQRDSALVVAGSVISEKDVQLNEKDGTIAKLEKKKRINRRLTLVLAILTFVLGTQL